MTPEIYFVFQVRRAAKPTCLFSCIYFLLCQSASLYVYVADRFIPKFGLIKRALVCSLVRSVLSCLVSCALCAFLCALLCAHVCSLVRSCVYALCALVFSAERIAHAL